jgi:hypothetical protein
LKAILLAAIRQKRLETASTPNTVSLDADLNGLGVRKKIRQLTTAPHPAG